MSDGVLCLHDVDSPYLICEPCADSLLADRAMLTALRAKLRDREWWHTHFKHHLLERPPGANWDLCIDDLVQDLGLSQEPTP